MYILTPKKCNWLTSFTGTIWSGLINVNTHTYIKHCLWYNVISGFDWSGSFVDRQTGLFGKMFKKKWKSKIARVFAWTSKILKSLTHYWVQMLGTDMHNRTTHVQDFKIPQVLKHFTEIKINIPNTSIIYADHLKYHTKKTKLQTTGWL